MPTTTNFGWTTPADTDLVKDGAAAMRTLGNSIDASFVDLKGGTTGQILSKASNTDLDYTWINNDQGDITEVQAGTGISIASGTGPIPVVTNTVATTFDAKGDLVAGTGADTFAKLTVGANNTVLTADSSTATGLKWVAPTSGATAWTLLNTGGTSLTGAATVTVSGISAKEIMVLIDNASSANAYAEIRVRPNNNSSAVYDLFGIYNVITTTYSQGNFDARGQYQTTEGIIIGQIGDSASDTLRGYCYIDKTDQTGFKSFQSAGSGRANNGKQQLTLGGILEFASAITSISINSSTGNLDNGTVYVYGAN